jgi:SSS family solute:Na+ symporter
VSAVAVSVFAFLFLLVTILGFSAARWRRAKSMDNLDEWGLGGRGFGTFVAWFLIGGDLYTAYTFIAVPATLFAGAAVGFFAVPYTILVYPLIFAFLPKLWSVSHKHGYVTPADFVVGRYGSRTLGLAVAITGLLATMPYIALQLVGMEVVLEVMGLQSDSSNWFIRDLPLFIAFAVLAAYTYSSGLRAPALIAFVKDTLIYVVILAAVLWIPHQLGGWDTIFGAADAKFDASPGPNDGLLLNANNQLQYITLALGSALALFLYPHSITGVLASRNRNVIKRNMSALPAYSLLLGLIALLGYMAIAAGIRPLPGASAGSVDSNTVVPLLFDTTFPDWFAGIAFAAVGIGALVPAAIMSIAAANLFTRNVYKEYLRRDASPAQEAQVSKVTSLVVKLGAVAVVVFLDPQFSIDLQLIGGVIILQTLPTVVLGLFTRWLHRAALIAGWFAGMAMGLWMLYEIRIRPRSGRTSAARCTRCRTSASTPG